MKQFLLSTVLLLVGCYGTSLTFGLHKSVSDDLVGTGSNSDPYRFDDDSELTYGVALTTWLDAPHVKVESQDPLPPLASESSYVEAIDALESWTPTKLVALAVPIAAIAIAITLFLRLRKKKE
jgi:hypothetical protein